LSGEYINRVGIGQPLLNRVLAISYQHPAGALVASRRLIGLCVPKTKSHHDPRGAAATINQRRIVF
jgi:hypothetical protein